MLSEDRSSLMILALGTCSRCHGTGMAEGNACACVNRSVFRAVLNKYRECAAGAHHLRPRSLEAIRLPRGKKSYGSKPSEFLADVELTAKRTLSPDDWKVFSAHHLLEADWKLCCQRLGMTRGNFFHACYRIEETLGRVFRELKPYALFPIDEYFQPTTKAVDARPLPVPAEPFPNGEPLRPPLAPRSPQARPQPVPVLCKPEPAPVPVVAPFNLTDPAAIAGYIRDRWKARRSLGGIAAELNRLGATPVNGTRWRSCDVKNVLLYAPRPATRKAA
jgi:hypothetical protein